MHACSLAWGRPRQSAAGRRSNDRSLPRGIRMMSEVCAASNALVEVASICGPTGTPGTCVAQDAQCQERGDNGQRMEMRCRHRSCFLIVPVGCDRLLQHCPAAGQQRARSASSASPNRIDLTPPTTSIISGVMMPKDWLSCSMSVARAISWRVRWDQEAGLLHVEVNVRRQHRKRLVTFGCRTWRPVGNTV